MHSSDIDFYLSRWRLSNSVQCTKVGFDSFLSGGFITAIVVNSPEMKQAKRTSVHCMQRSNSAAVHYGIKKFMNRKFLPLLIRWEPQI